MYQKVRELLCDQFFIPLMDNCSIKKNHHFENIICRLNSFGCCARYAAIADLSGRLSVDVTKAYNHNMDLHKACFT